MNTKMPTFLTFTALITVILLPLLISFAQSIEYANISVPEAKDMIDTDPSIVILDVRNESEYLAGHIRNARLIPLPELSGRLNELDTNDDTLVYCNTGFRSAQASQLLASNGFEHVYNMMGGITVWMNEQHPTYVKYVSIQQAIEEAVDGDEIYVAKGNYFEHLTIDKPISLIGENRADTMLEGMSNGTVVYVNADNVSISDFKIAHCGCSCSGYCGINVEINHKNINITNNHVFSNGYGIQVVQCREITISKNNFTSNYDKILVIHDSTNITVESNTIMDNINGVEIDNSTYCTFSDNSITTSVYGVILVHCENNTFYGNTIASNVINGLFINQSNNNSFIHNSFIKNAQQPQTRNSTNTWNNTIEGNYWSNYTGTDNDNDGIGDSPHMIDSQNSDGHPLMGFPHSFQVSEGSTVDVTTNSTLDRLSIDWQNNTIRLQVSSTGENQTTGFCRISIPHSLIDPDAGPIFVIVDNGQTPVQFINNTLYDNGTHRWIYFTYPHSTHEILIVPEIPTPLILTLVVATISIMLPFGRRRRIKPDRAHNTQTPEQRASHGVSRI